MQRQNWLKSKLHKNVLNTLDMGQYKIRKVCISLNAKFRMETSTAFCDSALLC